MNWKLFVSLGILGSWILCSPCFADSNKTVWTPLYPVKVSKSAFDPSQMMGMLKQKQATPKKTTPKAFSQEENLLYQKLLNLIVSPCCWNQAISLHGSAKSEEIKEDLRTRILAGEKFSQITKAYLQKYGDRILSIPPHQDIFWIPVIGAVIILLFFFVFWSQWQKNKILPTSKE